MSRQPSSRDLQKLSAYLDGELNASASRKIKDRLTQDPNLLVALEDLRDTRAILRRMPARRAPRSFTLSPQMVAKRPPMPRLIPALNYATVLAMLLFFISFIPPIGFGAMAPPAPEMMMESADMAMEEPAPAEEPAAAPAMEAPVEEEFAVAEEPAEEETVPMDDEPTAGEEAPKVSPTAEYSATPRVATEAEKSTPNQEADGVIAPTPSSTETMVAEMPAINPSENVSEGRSPRPIFSSWQKMLLGVIILFPLMAYALRRAIKAKWQKASK